MPLNILRATEPVHMKTVVILGYAPPGSGKTSLGFTAHTPLLLDFDLGAHRSGFRGDSVPVHSWADVESMSEKDLEPYGTVVVDTVGRCLDSMALAIIQANPKMGRTGGQLSLQGFGELKGKFAAWLRLLRGFGKDIVLLAHAVEKKDGEETIIRPDIQGSSVDEVLKQAEGVFYLRMVDRTRTIEWDPRDKYYGKNPAMLDAMNVPHLGTAPEYLGTIIDTIKDRIGAISAKGAEVRALVDGFRIKIEEAAAAQELTALVPVANAIEPAPAKIQVKALIAARAKALGLAWNAETSSFATKGSTVLPTEPAKPEPAKATKRSTKGTQVGLLDQPEPGASDEANQ